MFTSRVKLSFSNHLRIPFTNIHTHWWNKLNCEIVIVCAKKKIWIILWFSSPRDHLWFVSSHDQSWFVTKSQREVFPQFAVLICQVLSNLSNSRPDYPALALIPDLLCTPVQTHMKLYLYLYLYMYLYLYACLHTWYLSSFLHNHNLSPGNFTLESA